MAKKINLILGNGFTIDFLSHAAIKKPAITSEIDVLNLFTHGDKLKWPADSKPGFLSFKNCPHLWNIGARSHLKHESATELLERVVTSANVYSLKSNPHIDEKTGNGFLHAYKELVSYLKYLFIYYNEKINEIPEIITDWAWADFFISLERNDEIEEVTIVTYNYDIWLERILNSLNISFDLPLLTENRRSKFKIFKPHGSISYHHKVTLPQESFEINYRTFASDCAISDMLIDYENLFKHTPLHFIIPPAGDPGRANTNWAQALRNECITRIKNYTNQDIAIICGISYWHVDRAEIDNLLINLNSDMDVIHINPQPSTSLDSVLHSLFKNYIHMKSSNFLKEFQP